MENKLAIQIGFEVTATFVGSVMAFAGFRALAVNAESASTFTHYFWTAGFLGALVYLLLLIRLRKRIIRPLGEVADHVEDLSMGIFQKWGYPEFHNELDEVAAMMNYVADYNNNLQNSWRTLSFAIAPHMAKLRGCEDLPENLRADLDETWDHLRGMDESIMGVFSPSPQFSKPRLVPDQVTTEVRPETGQSPNPPRDETKQEEPRQITTGALMEAVVNVHTGLPETCA